MQGDPLHSDVYTRRFSGAFVIVNASATSSYIVNLPKPSYQSMDGFKITSPLLMAPDDSQVLMTTNGCQ